jgi:hypothetical protein
LATLSRRSATLFGVESATTTVFAFGGTTTPVNCADASTEQTASTAAVPISMENLTNPPRS